MTMTAGTVSVDANENVSGGGMARAIYDADAATLVLPIAPTPGDTSPPYRVEQPASAGDRDIVKAARVKMLQEVARRANAYAAGIIAHITANAVATIGTGVSAGRTPNPNNPDTAIQGPAVAVNLPIS